MKLVQMFFDWLRPQAPQASARGAVDQRPKQTFESKETQTQTLILTPPVIVEAERHQLGRRRAGIRPRLGEGPVGPLRETKQDLYDRMVREMCERYGVRVRKWRTSMSGIAWYVEYRDGRIQRLIESPRPKSPMSAAIFLHEIGHHHIGLGIHKPRCLEEYMAWMYSLEQMAAWNIEVTDRVKTRVYKSLRYAVRKAQRRGIRELPAELLAYAGERVIER